MCHAVECGLLRRAQPDRQPQVDGGILAFGSRWAFKDFCMLLGNTVVSAFLYHNMKLAKGVASTAHI